MLKHLACPECGGKNMSELNDWTATSNEPHDRDNSGTLIEFQCRDCGRAIWLGADACPPDLTQPQPRDTAKALTWVMREAVDLSLERLPGLSPADAASEIRDLMAIRELAVSLTGGPKRGDELDRIGAELAFAHSAFA